MGVRKLIENMKSSRRERELVAFLKDIVDYVFYDPRKIDYYHSFARKSEQKAKLDAARYVTERAMRDSELLMKQKSPEIEAELRKFWALKALAEERDLEKMKQFEFLNVRSDIEPKLKAAKHMTEKAMKASELMMKLKWPEIETELEKFRALKALEEEADLAKTKRFKFFKEKFNFAFQGYTTPISKYMYDIDDDESYETHFHLLQNEAKYNIAQHVTEKAMLARGVLTKLKKEEIEAEVRKFRALKALAKERDLEADLKFFLKG